MMTNIVSFNKALKSLWVQKYLDSNNMGKWKLFIASGLNDLGGPMVLNTFKRKDTTEKDLQIS